MPELEQIDGEGLGCTTRPTNVLLCHSLSSDVGGFKTLRIKA